MSCARVWRNRIAQVKEGVSYCARALHRVGEVIASSAIVAVQEVGVADRGKDPGRGVPLSLRFGEKIPGEPIVLERFGKAPRLGVSVSKRAKALDLAVDRVREFCHKGLLLTPNELGAARCRPPPAGASLGSPYPALRSRRFSATRRGGKETSFRPLSACVAGELRR